MQEINIYELTKTPWTKAFPKLVETISSKGNKVVVLCKNSESMQEMDGLLWTFEQLSFLPHVTENDKMIEETPVLLVANDNSKAKEFSNIYALSNLEIPGEFHTQPGKFLLMYESQNEMQKSMVEQTEKIANDRGMKISKFIQTEKGWGKVES